MLYRLSNILFFLSIFLFGLYPLIPEEHESFIPIFFIVVSLFNYLTNRKQQILWKPLIIMVSVFLIFLISAFFSENRELGFKKIETMASLIGLPLAFFIFIGERKLNFEKLERYFNYTFFIANVIFSLIAFYLLSYYRNPKFSSYDSDFYRNAIADIPYIGDHSIYLSLFLSISILIGTNLLIKKQIKQYIKFLVSLSMLLITALLLLMMSKGVLLGLIFSLIAIFVSKSKYWKKSLLFGLFLILLGIILLPKQNNRFLELINKSSFDKVDVNNSTSVRFYILKSSLNLCLEQPIFGYGLGDVQKELDDEYKLNGLPLPKGQYNSHNQYLFVWLSCGIFGLLMFILYLTYIIRLGFITRDYFLVSITILYATSFLFENVLSRQSGVILFAFIVNFLIFKNLRIKSKAIL